MTTSELKTIVSKLPDDKELIILTEGGTICRDVQFADETVHDLLIMMVRYPWQPFDTP